MIRSKILRKLSPEIENAVSEIFELSKKNEKKLNDFILLLANGLKMKGIGINISPYTVGRGMEGIIDSTRFEFFSQYMNTPFENQYNSQKSKESKKQTHFLTIYLELMIYSHLWESIPFLKKLKNLTNLVNSIEYDWDIKIPFHGKSKFIEDSIIKILENNNLEIAKLLRKCYDRNLRNAFAHSEYYILNKNIFYYEFNKNQKVQKKISFSEFEEKFLITALLDNFIYKKIIDYKKDIDKLNKAIEVFIPNDKNGEYFKKYLIFDKRINRFIWKRN